MFLNHLTDEEKHRFMQLANVLLHIDTKFIEKSPMILQEYCREIGIDFKDCLLDFSEIADTAKTLMCDIVNKTTRKVFFIEIIGLFLADGNISEQEKVIIEQMKECFQLTDKCVDELTEVAKGLLSLYMKAEEIFHNDTEI